MCHVALRHTGATFASQYLAVSASDGHDRVERRAWADEPYYVATVELAEHLLGTVLAEDRVMAVLRHSREMNLLAQLSASGDDLRQVGISQQMVPDYSIYAREATGGRRRLQHDVSAA